MSERFFIVEPKHESAPILLSSPHSGTEFPNELRSFFREDVLKDPKDTDWHIPTLYDFAANAGIALIHARYSRYVVDLNRDPGDVPLYNDDRFLTGLFPTHSFARELLYKDEETCSDALGELDRKWRMDLYYWPYYRALQERLSSLQRKFGKALLFDAHSIARSVPSIQNDPFPDLILGTQMGFTAHPRLIETALQTLEKGPFQVSHNVPFRGGNITRTHGNPSMGIHSMQLELSQDLYLDPVTKRFDAKRAEPLQKLLARLLRELNETMESI